MPGRPKSAVPSLLALCHVLILCHRWRNLKPGSLLVYGEYHHLYAFPIVHCDFFSTGVIFVNLIPQPLRCLFTIQGEEINNIFSAAYMQYSPVSGELF